MAKQRILVIEDDDEIVELIGHQIQDLGYSMESAGDGEEGLQKALSGDFAMLVLDLMLPNLGGMEICRRLRKEKEALPILMLTARSEDIDKILGLEVGADDYLTKPFNVLEFRARARALLRRSQTTPFPSDQKGENLLRYKDLVIDDQAHIVTLEGQALELTRTEYDLLKLFLSRPGKVFTREELLREIWNNDISNYEYNVTTHVSRLRAKLGTSKTYLDCIKTVRGVGYRFVPDETVE